MSLELKDKIVNTKSGKKIVFYLFLIYFIILSKKKFLKNFYFIFHFIKKNVFIFIFIIYYYYYLYFLFYFIFQIKKMSLCV